MKSNELRIGNYVEGYNGKVFQWSLFDFATCNNDVNADEIGKPIPLTEEWLIKFGFEKDKKLEHLLCKYPIVVNTGNHNIISLGQPHQETNRIFPYQMNMSVHQLQNLYFALTGEELKIKE